MKLIREYIKELLAEDYEMKRPTVGAILDAIEIVQTAESEKRKRLALKKLEKDLGWKLGKMIPVIGPVVGAVKDAASVYKTLKSATEHVPEKMGDPVLDLLLVDPGYKEMLDDSVEFEFDQDMMSYLNSLPREAPLPDMTAELENWVQKKFDRKISGADISESLLRQFVHGEPYIRSLLLEDKRRRKQLATDLYNAGVRYDRWIGDPETIPAGKRGEAMKDIMAQGRVLKKAFAKNADRAFLDSLVTVHWFRSERTMRQFLGGSFSSRDELSTAAYIPGQIKGLGKFGRYGILIKGHITLLANDMDQLYTGSTDDYTAADPERTKMSGANKGAQQIYEPRSYREYRILVLDEEDWDPEVRGVDSNQNNEALVDNWSPLALIVPDSSYTANVWDEDLQKTEPAGPDTAEAEKWEELAKEAGLDIPVMTHSEFSQRPWV